MSPTQSKILNILTVVILIATAVVFIMYLRSKSVNKKESIIAPSASLEKLPPAAKPISSCLVLEEKYCSQAKKLLYNNKYPMIGLNLPVNTKIYSPLAGNIVLSTAIFKKGDKSYSYTSILIEPRQIFSYANGQNVYASNYTYALVFNYDPASQKKDKADQNQPVASLSAKKIDLFGDYNLIVYVMKKNKNLLTIDSDQTLKLFKL